MTKVLPKVEKEKKRSRRKNIFQSWQHLGWWERERERLLFYQNEHDFVVRHQYQKAMYHLKHETWSQRPNEIMWYTSSLTVNQTLLKITSSRSSMEFGNGSKLQRYHGCPWTQYDDTTETEALLSELFSTTQGKKESVAEFGGWLHSIAYKIRQSQGDDDEFVQQNFSGAWRMMP